MIKVYRHSLVIFQFFEEIPGIHPIKSKKKYFREGQWGWGFDGVDLLWDQRGDCENFIMESVWYNCESKTNRKTYNEEKLDWH